MLLGQSKAREERKEGEPRKPGKFTSPAESEHSVTLWFFCWHEGQNWRWLNLLSAFDRLKNHFLLRVPSGWNRLKYLGHMVYGPQVKTESQSWVKVLAGEVCFLAGKKRNNPGIWTCLSSENDIAVSFQWLFKKLEKIVKTQGESTTALQLCLSVCFD